MSSQKTARLGGLTSKSKSRSMSKSTMSAGRSGSFSCEKNTGMTTTSKLNSILQEEKNKNDVVLKEFPVFLCKSLSKQLSLVQYPQRPSTVSTQNMNIIQTRIKPGQNKIQLTIGMDQESELYDRIKAEELAEAAEGLGLDEDKYMPDDVHPKLDRTMMESSTVPKLAEMSRYAIGVVRNGQVTLTPISSIIQMKTVLPHLNKADKAKSAFLREQSGADMEDEEEEATKVTIKFTRNTAAHGDKQGTSSSSGRGSSYSARRKEEDEPWVDLEYVGDDPVEFDKLYTTQPSSPFYVLNKKEYLEALFPKHLETCIEGGDEKGKHNPKISIQQMRTMAVSGQLKVLLSNAKVLQYYQIVDFLKTKLKSEVDEASLVKSIQTVAILVQGCWVVKSDVIYSEDFKSGANGISGVVMQRGRDTILSQFTEHRFLERKRMIALTKLPSEEVTEILAQVSTMVPRKGWEFILPYDTNFLGRFPDVVERQSLIWQMKKQQQQRARHSSSCSTTETSLTVPQRRRSRNKSISSGDDSGSGPESDHRHARGSRRRRQSDNSRGGGGRRQRRNSTRSEVGIPSRVET